LLDEIEITLRGKNDSDLHNIWINVADNTLSRKWLGALNHLIEHNYHVEKNYCWLGWTGTDRNVELLCDFVNRSITHINNSGLDYHIATDPFTPESIIQENLDINHDRMNQLHRWFEDLQGWSGGISNHYTSADPETRWHIRQLNLLCHELESLVLSMRKDVRAPEWKRPSQLMCWLGAPRFELEEADYDLFGIDTINRSMGGVYVGVNKAVGKHHWEVFCDEGRDSRISELVTSSLRPQNQAAGDFDIEWANNPGSFPWQIAKLRDFKEWLKNNGFNPDDKNLTIGHPQVGQVDLKRSFGTTAYAEVWGQLSTKLDVYKIRTSSAEATYEYKWNQPDYAEIQQRYLK
jgi:hypothetical protein